MLRFSALINGTVCFRLLWWCREIHGCNDLYPSLRVSICPLSVISATSTFLTHARGEAYMPQCIRRCHGMHAWLSPLVSLAERSGATVESQVAGALVDLRGTRSHAKGELLSTVSHTQDTQGFERGFGGHASMERSCLMGGGGCWIHMRSVYLNSW